MEWLNIHGAHRSKPIMSSPPPFECVTEQKRRQLWTTASRDASKKTCRTSVRFDDNISCRWRTGFRSGLQFGCPCRASLLTPNGCWETLHRHRGAKTPASQRQDKELLPSLHYFLVYMTSISHFANFCCCFDRSVINLIGLSCVPP